MKQWTQLHSVIATAVFLAGLGFWTANNVVFAGDYQRYQTQQQIRWLMYDERQLYNEYREMERLKVKNHSDRLRMADIEHDMKLKRAEIKAMR